MISRLLLTFLNVDPERAVQRSSADRTVLGHIWRGGDQSLRRALLLASLSAAMGCYRKAEGPSCLVSLLNRKPIYLAVSAHASRLARTSCQMLIDGMQFEEKAARRLTSFGGKGQTGIWRRGEAPHDD